MGLSIEDIEVVKKIVNEEFDKREKIISIGRLELNELKEIVRNLAIDQKETKIEINELKSITKELIQAQKRTELRVEELAEAQKRSEIKIEELAEAQKRTEQELHELVKEHKKTREQLGGLSLTVGFTLEDKAYKALPELLKKDFNITIKDRLKRDYITDNKGKYMEINIIGKALKDNEEIMIIGESKSQLSKNNVDEFIRRLNRLKGIFREKIFPILVTYMVSEPDVQNYLEQNNIKLYYSYDF